MKVGECRNNHGKYINSSHYITRVVQENENGWVCKLCKNRSKTIFLNFGSLGLVHLIGVDNDYQGKQYGIALLSHSIHELLKQGISKIVVNQS
jgi:N-acetylglutamate synthase-like GNAT family acetyltransferase